MQAQGREAALPAKRPSGAAGVRPTWVRCDGVEGARACPLERHERCERLSAGAQTCAATDRNCIEGRGSLAELAQDREAHRYGADGTLERQGAGELQAPGRELTARSWGISMTVRLNKLGNFLRGWFGYFGVSQYYWPIPVLDEWLRRRVRMCYWKQWRWPRTKISHLLALGVRLKTAIQHGVSSTELLAYGANPGGTAGPFQCLTGGARPPQRHGPVVQGPGLLGSSHFVERANSLNRPLRTPTVGGVGAGGEKPPATRLAPVLIVADALD
jgi:hypothetical protein